MSVTRLNQKNHQVEPTTKLVGWTPTNRCVGFFCFPSQHRVGQFFQHAKMQDQVSSASEYLGVFVAHPMGSVEGGEGTSNQTGQNGGNFFTKKTHKTNQKVFDTLIWWISIIIEHNLLTSPPLLAPLHLCTRVWFGKGTSPHALVARHSTESSPFRSSAPVRGWKWRW